ncbi:SIR2 family protein [Candidatus Macondimonas diazotrophica]|jgi:hypothetical protein|nr:SIR2 family protein [Candidatus Macondimonas diazotrophica]
MNDTNHLEVIASGLSAGRMIPYLGPGMVDLCPEAGTVPASLEALATFLGSKVTVPGRARGNLGASAQYIENFKHRKTLVDLMRQAFAPTLTPSPLHRTLAALPSIPLIVQLWYDDVMRTALAGWPDFGLIQGLSQSEHFGTWYQAMAADGTDLELTALAERTLVLYQPWGAVEPRPNFLVSDADFVEVLTEIDIQTPIPPLVQERRRDRAFLFLGCRFTSQTERIFAHQISKRSSETHYAVLAAEPTRNEARFLEQHGITRLELPLAAFADALQAQLTAGRTEALSRTA